MTAPTSPPSAEDRIDLLGGWYFVKDTNVGNDDACWYLSNPEGVFVAPMWDGPEAGEADARELASALQSALAAAQAASVAGVQVTLHRNFLSENGNVRGGQSLYLGAYEGQSIHLEVCDAPEPSADLARLIAEARADERKAIAGVTEAVMTRLERIKHEATAMQSVAARVSAEERLKGCAEVLDAIRALAPPATGTAETGGAQDARMIAEARADEREKCVTEVEKYAKEREEAAQDEESTALRLRCLLYAKHVRRAGDRIRALAPPATGTAETGGAQDAS